MHSSLIVASFLGWIVVSGWGLVNMCVFGKTFRFTRARATIVSKREQTRFSDDDGGDDPIGEEVVSYTYEVDGRRYRGTSDDDVVGAWTPRFPEQGEAIAIFYDPDDPEVSRTTRAGFYAGVGIFLLGFQFFFGALWLIDQLG